METEDRTKDEYIGISENKIKHILGVANECYKISKEKYKIEEDFCQRMFIIGFLHDIGYAFSENREDHPEIGFDLLLDIFGISENVDSFLAVKYHGLPDAPQFVELKILNEADLSVDSRGNIVGPEKRLLDVKDRYTEDSKEYKNALSLAEKLNLL